MTKYRGIGLHGLLAITSGICAPFMAGALRDVVEDEPEKEVSDGLFPEDRRALSFAAEKRARKAAFRAHQTHAGRRSK